jgi:hypothetical protein
MAGGDGTVSQEIEALRAYYRERGGELSSAVDFWAPYRPHVIADHRKQESLASTDSGEPYALPNVLALLHYHAIVGYEEGVAGETRRAFALGATKDSVLATIAVAFIHAGPRGIHSVALGATDTLRDHDDTGGASWPDGWEPDPDAFRSRMDFGDPELSPADLEALECWYLAVSGEVPPHVTFLAQHSPHVLKAARYRFEFAIRDALPKQMMPYLQLHYDTIRGFGDGVREAALMARGFGMSDAEIAGAVSAALLYSGVEAASIVARATADLFGAG